MKTLLVEDVRRQKSADSRGYGEDASLARINVELLRDLKKEDLIVACPNKGKGQENSGNEDRR